MKQAVFDWAKASVRTGVVVYWGEQDAPSPALARVRLNFISPAQARGQDEDRSEGIHIVIPAAVDSTDYTVTLGVTPFVHNSGVGATVTSIRDGLLALIDAGPEAVTVTALDDDRIRVQFDDGDLPASSSANVTLKKRQVRVGTRELTLSVEVMAEKNADIATPVLEELRGGLENEAYNEILQAGGWAWIEVLGTRKSPAVIGGKWQDRTGFDLRLCCRSLNVGETDWIDTVEIKTEGLPGAV